ncbi:hypothetical protein FZEAL_2249 [Fusarium zealandicum]|uniref:Zn(2)-C6 fungal-type domain-containing protein n=1 Tax=Fusarium zealandicum TaxID=1053134 RepID=A0A8H4URG7_9HYPO|nr:hypothetical protein FZEAL_2249 [Fusarium zealandicum]
MSFPQDWHGYSSVPFTTETINSGFNSPLDFADSHPARFPVPGDSQHPSVESPEGVTAQGQRRTSTSTPAKGKRVRTGCLTCRERHLKCDEAIPDCMNCRKRGRECKRGVRLNFLEINLHRPASVPAPKEWAVEFQDESRDIASEYKGGLGRYAPYDPGCDNPDDHEEVKPLRMEEGYQEPVAATDRPQSSSRRLPVYNQEPTTPRAPGTPVWQHHEDAVKLENIDASGGLVSDVSNIATPSSSTHSTTTPRLDSVQEQLIAMRSRPSPRPISFGANIEREMPHLEKPPRFERVPLEQHLQDNPLQRLPSEMTEPTGRHVLSSTEEVYYMQVFVEEVAVWMDSFNKDKGFGRNIPHHALKSTMLLNALLACGAKHTSLVSPENHDKALFYYNTATTQLLRSLQNPDRNTAECATTAIVLNVYEIMSEKPAQRMSHIAGSRALIRECGWNATSTGIGSACFWLNIGIEVLNCLATNWQTTWNPDEWGMDFDFSARNDRSDVADQQVWVHRILYMVAKVANFRGARIRSEDMNPRDEQLWIASRVSQWHELKNLCDDWNNNCPRTMHPFGYVKPSKTKARALFPRIWLIQREATVGRLLYHAAQCILSQTHPLEPTTFTERMRILQLYHAHQVCGIVAHTADRGVAIVAIRCLAIAGAVLINPNEQAEVLDMLDKIGATSGWRLGAVEMDLKKAWGWERVKLPLLDTHVEPGQDHAAILVRRASATITPARVSTPPMMAPVGTKTPVNPLSFADFKLPNHPYQNWYEPPNRTGPSNPPLL